MKFYCDSCNTKYGIADEKVRGKVLKVRCKKCGSVITVREQTVPSQRAASSPTAPPPPSPSKPTIDPRQVQWHYSINGQSFGPYAFDVLAQRFASGELGDECYVWTDSFSDWRPVKQVDAFSSALADGQRIKPRRKTLGVSQALEAIKPEDFEKRLAQNKQKAQAVQEPAEPEEDPQPVIDEPKATEPQQAEPQQAEPQQAEPEESGPEETAEQQDAQKDRLAKLRARLKSTGASQSAADAGDEPADALADEPDGDLPIEAGLAADGGSVQPSADAQSGSYDGPDESLDGQADPLGPTVSMGDAHKPDGFDGEEDEGVNSGLFADFDAPEPSSESAGDDAQAAEDSDHIPFFGDAPELGSESDKIKSASKTEASGITGSLLIQLDNIQKQGRGKKAAIIVAAILIVGGLTATAVYFAGQVEPEKRVAAKKSGQEEDDELVIRTYSDDEQNKIMMLDGQRVGKNEGSEEAAKEEAAAKVASKQKTGASKRRQAAPKIKDDGPSLDDAFNSAQKKGASTDSFRKGLDDGKVAKTKLDSPLAGKSDAFNSLTALSAERNDPIYRPTDTLKAREKKSASGGMKLTRKQISQGIRTVRRSVGICRQRHSRRGTPLDARKIYLTLTVEPSGRVSSFDLEPKRIKHTEFEKCMNSHRGRWKFPSFDGSSQKMRAPFVLQ